MKQYIYRPNLQDQNDPCIIMGEAIAPGSEVTVQKTNIDPARLFVWILDGKGNMQTVMKSSLTSLEEESQE